MVTIYKITNPAGEQYIGQTKCLRVRKATHKWMSKNGGQALLYESINKYGWDKHKIEIIEQVEKEIGDERERFWIKELGTYFIESGKGLNMTVGGLGRRGDWMWNTELRKYMSETYRGENSSFYGHKHTDEAKAIMAEKASKRNKERGTTVPKWGAEKGRLKIIRSVLCYDKYGNFLRQYDSVTDAATELQIERTSICMVCSFKRTHVGGYVFRYFSPNYPLKIDVKPIKEQAVKRPVLYLDKDLKIIKEYPSALEAHQDLGVPKGTINRASLHNNMRPIRTGHIFIYKDLYEKSLRDAGMREAI